VLLFAECHFVTKQSIDLHSAEVSRLKSREKELLHKVIEHFCVKRECYSSNIIIVLFFMRLYFYNQFRICLSRCLF